MQVTTNLNPMSNQSTMPVWPKKNTKFWLYDFFQVEVDEFHSGHFLFLSAKMVDLKCDADTLQKIETLDEVGLIVSTYCYDTKSYYKILVCGYKAKEYQNNYHIRAGLSESNSCDGYAVHGSFNEFKEWMKF